MIMIELPYQMAIFGILNVLRGQLFDGHSLELAPLSALRRRISLSARKRGRTKAIKMQEENSENLFG